MATPERIAKLVELLNDVLTAELTAINQYFLHSEMCENWGYERLHKAVRHHSIDEMKHAEKIIQRILFLKGVPNVQRLSKINIGETVPEQLAADLALEREAIDRLNAGIEASRAGEHGTGFTFVAREIKELAEESKAATAQIRQILGEIQRATNTAVMATEEGTKSVNVTIATINEAGETIRQLADTIAEAAKAGAQISASSVQQATGMTQIHQAVREIDTATHQSVASNQQTEQAARDLAGLGTRLGQLIGRAGFGRAQPMAAE